jgi:hypothetical protein
MRDAVARRCARLALGLASVSSVLVASSAQAAPFVWKGYTWTLTSGGMAGVADGSPSNVSIDASGYLHLKIVKTGDA